MALYREGIFVLGIIQVVALYYLVMVERYIYFDENQKEDNVPISVLGTELNEAEFINAASLPVYCASRKIFEEHISADPFNREQKPTTSNLYDTPSPFDCTSRQNAIVSDRIIIPSRRWSNKLNARNFGGFTADMGWILLVARYAITNGVLMTFPPYWGHGCGDGSQQRWTCFFQPIIPSSCLANAGKKLKERFVYESVPEDRHDMKLKAIYNSPDRSVLETRNKKISEYSGSWLRANNDAEAMRQVFHWVFRLRDDVREKVDLRKKKILPEGWTNYIAVHIRWGDKLGFTEKDHIREGVNAPLTDYVNVIRCYYAYSKKQIPNRVFIATDDYEAFLRIKELLGPGFIVITSATPTDKGFSISQYRDDQQNLAKFESGIRLWADLEILSGGAVLVGNYESNVIRMTHLMRIGKQVNTTLSIPLSRHYMKRKTKEGNEPLHLTISDYGKTCCAKEFYLANCFWKCA